MQFMDGHSPKVLVVDDDPDIRALVTGLVQLCGGEVAEMGSGGNLCELALQESPDLIILDVMLPDCSGFDLLQALRTDERTGHIPVIMLTGANDFELGRRHTAASLGRELGVRPPEGFVEKPPNTKEFLELLKDILER